MVIVVAGEALIDLVPADDGTLVPHAGGGPFNTARALGRLGCPVAYLGRVSTDHFGARLAGLLAEDGVRLDAHVRTDDPTTLALVELDDRGAAAYRFYTEGTASAGLTPQAALTALPADAAYLHVGTLGLVLEPMADALEALVEERAGRALVMSDPNCRPAIIADAPRYRDRLARVLRGTDVVKVSDDDLAWLAPGVPPGEAARALLAQGPAVVLLTCGADGALALTADGETAVAAPAGRRRRHDRRRRRVQRRLARPLVGARAWPRRPRRPRRRGRRDRLRLPRRRDHLQPGGRPAADPRGADMSRADDLRVLLDGPEAEIRAMVREWLSEPGHAPVTDLPREEYRALVTDWAEELAMSGGTAMGYPAEFGGLGDVRGSIAGFETLAFGDLSLLVKCGVQFGLFGGAVLHLGTMRHHERHLTAIARFELPGCFAMSESDHGSNVQALQTTATYDAATEEFVVHTPTPGARKDYIGNAARDGRLAVVFAQLVSGGEPRGVHALLVPLRDAGGELVPGVSIEDCGPKLGLDGVDNGRIAFDQVRVARDALLDRYATVQRDGTYASPIENPAKRFFVMLGTLIQGRVSVCGASITASKSALDIAIRHALERRQFGAPGREEALLLDYRTHQRRLLPALATTYGLHFAQAQLVDRLHEAFCAEVPERSRRELETLAAGLKAVASSHATATIQTCREACGGLGYLQESRLPALMADTEVFPTFEGDNTVLLQLAAKNLLTGYRDQLGELDPLGLASFFAGQVIGTIAERTAVRKVLGALASDLLPGRDDGGPLRDRAEQRGLLRWRHEHLLQGAARRLKGGIDAGRDPFDVLLDCQDHVVEAARAWVDHVVLEAFAAAAGADPALDRLCSLYALSRVEAERGYYQEHGRLTAARSKAVIRAVNTLCAELRPDAGLLVEAFGVPEMTAAPAAAMR